MSINNIINEFDNTELISWNNISYENNYLLNKICIYGVTYLIPQFSYQSLYISPLYNISIKLYCDYANYMYDISKEYGMKLQEFFRIYYENLIKIVYDIEHITGTIHNKSTFIHNCMEYYFIQLFFIYTIHGEINNFDFMLNVLYLQNYILYLINNNSIIILDTIKDIILNNNYKNLFISHVIKKLISINRAYMDDIIIILKKILNNSTVVDNVNIMILLYKYSLLSYSHVIEVERENMKLIFIYYLCRDFYDLDFHLEINKKTIFTLIYKDKNVLDNFLNRMFSNIQTINNKCIKKNIIFFLLYTCCINKDYILAKRYNFIITKYLYDYKGTYMLDIKNNLKQYFKIE
jgi:hypothetical protein